MTLRRNCSICGSPAKAIPSDLSEEQEEIIYYKCTHPRCVWIAKVRNWVKDDEEDKAGMPAVQMSLPD